jgi:hypothetical protein
LLEILNELELKHYDESVSSVHSNYNKSETGKYSIYGQPQPNYKIYSNNYLPPASMKNKKSSNYRKLCQIKVLANNVTDEIKENNEVNIVAADFPEISKSPDPKQLTQLIEVSENIVPDISKLSELDSKSKWRDYAYFDDDYEYDYSWINKKYLLEDIVSSDDGSAKGSTKNSISCQDLDAKLPDNLVKLEDLSKKLNNSIGLVDQTDQYHYIESGGSMFVGEAIKHGTGVLFYIDPETKIQLKYKGDFKYDLRDGYGEQSFKDGCNYFGFWEKDRPNGKGKIVMKDNSSFNGSFKNGVLSKDDMLIEIEGSNLKVTDFKNVELQIASLNLEKYASEKLIHIDDNESLYSCNSL